MKPTIVLSGLACFLALAPSSAGLGSPTSNEPSNPAVMASAPNPLALSVVASSNAGLQANLLSLTPFTAMPLLLVDIKLPGSIPDISTTGFICQLLTLQPAQGCLETQLTNCTQQSWCTSLEEDNCTNGDWCTIAAICTNTEGCTDAGTCTEENGCTGTEHCTQGSGCTQHDSCTNGSHCTDDQDLCTGGLGCTVGTGCTNGENCTGSTGCTKDAQCTQGPNCTSGGGGSSLCTNGTHCTQGVNCATKANNCTQTAPECTSGGGVCTNESQSCTAESECEIGEEGVEVTFADPIDRVLSNPGRRDPLGDAHFAPKSRAANMGWLALLALPLLARRRSRES